MGKRAATKEQKKHNKDAATTLATAAPNALRAKLVKGGDVMRASARSGCLSGVVALRRASGLPMPQSAAHTIAHRIVQSLCDRLTLFIRLTLFFMF